ncbi:MAG: YbaY family lipoprotein [Oscillochloridaceae bacterium]|nr:YbaY family lipoprotein [Chloroflexaceae bacterium]MDW8391422.1 YbaY family lipoprotein [Oscillochloridaceae bacterium]
MKALRLAFVVLFAIAFLALPGPAAAQTAPAAVSGTLSLLERVALPGNAVVTVQIAEVATAGRPGALIAEQRFTTNNAQPPFRYTVTYDPARIDPNRAYTVQANISFGGQIRYTTNRVYRVITGGAPVSDVNIVLVSSRLPPTTGGRLPLLIAGLALLGAVAVFAARRLLAPRREQAERGERVPA